MSYSSVHVFCLLDRTIQICVSCFRAVKMGSLSTVLSYWPLDVHAMAKNSSEDLRIRIVALHKDAEGYKSSVTPWNWVTVQWPESYKVFKTGFTRNRPRKGRSKSWVLVLCVRCRSWPSKNRRMSAASIALEVAEVEGQLVSAQTIRHTLQQVGLHGCHPRRKPLMKLAHKKSLQTVCWRQTWQEHELLSLCSDELMSCGLMSLR